ncbi:protein Flattop-like [Octopus sinensis]|uniref:Cilia- and flagella-associated protein 126 n=1 Tax=Octopus sinensis TaxID=2607531 RepID=A0A6P7U1J5_9MOLL|nr:protein Flattop-like [Octopus sinensis]
MSIIFNASQYEDAYRPKRLGNWEIPNLKTFDGFTEIIADNRGHLKDNKRDSKFSWSTYIGTWDLPKSIPGNHVSTRTSRSAKAVEKLESGLHTANETIVQCLQRRQKNQVVSNI